MASSTPAPTPDVPHSTNWKGALIGMLFALMVLGVAGASIAIAYDGGDSHSEKTEKGYEEGEGHDEDSDEGHDESEGEGHDDDSDEEHSE